LALNASASPSANATRFKKSIAIEGSVFTGAATRCRSKENELMITLPSRRSIATFGALSLVTAAAQAADPNLELLNVDPFFYTADRKISAGEAGMTGFGDAGSRPTKTHSLIPHLPFYTGYMETNQTYRFVTVAEQVMTMIGEGKHGLWRMQENGTVRFYLRPGQTGLPVGTDVSTTAAGTINTKYITHDYALGFPLYKYPDNQVTNSALNFIDVPLNHAVFGGKYANHEPIDLPSFYCTMNGSVGYPQAAEVMDYVFQQPAANVVGPLGKRAGLDVTENYIKVIRLKHFPDARSWVNVGQDGKDRSHVNWLAVDTTKTDAEYYLVERPFFNLSYLFVIGVYNNRQNKDLQYVRPEGLYYDSLVARKAKVKTELTHAPRFNVLNYRSSDGAETRAGLKRVVGTQLFGVHHPNRNAFGGGGACPSKGGDYGDYPTPGFGAGWPTQYEEVTPLCDGVLVDIKFVANLDGGDWADSTSYLANAARNSLTVQYNVKPGTYGKFTDSYNVKRGATNPDEAAIPAQFSLTFPSKRAPVTFTPRRGDASASLAVESKTKLAESAAASTPAASTFRNVASSGMTPVGSSCRPIPASNWVGKADSDSL
jgi:hypothetical protein